MLSQKELEFLKRRKQMLSSWRIVAFSLLLALIVLFLWLFFNTPYIANPLFVANILKEGSLTESTMTVSSLILPIIVSLLFLSSIIFVLFGFQIIGNEKKYMAMIRKYQSSIPADTSTEF